MKRTYFHKELKKIENRERNRLAFFHICQTKFIFTDRYVDVAIRVRRNQIFGDSFRELHRLRPGEWKARFYIMFEGEEGQDAGKQHKQTFN